MILQPVRSLLLLSVATLAMTESSSPSQAQYGRDRQILRMDQQALQQEQYRLRQDVQNGNIFGVLRDVNQIDQTQQYINMDRQAIRQDLYGNPYYYQPAVVQPNYPYYQQQYVQQNPGVVYQQPVVQQPVVQQPVQQQTLIPHPQYPGYYYYPSNPGQLYIYPAR